MAHRKYIFGATITELKQLVIVLVLTLYIYKKAIHRFFIFFNNNNKRKKKTATVTKDIFRNYKWIVL